MHWVTGGRSEIQRENEVSNRLRTLLFGRDWKRKILQGGELIREGFQAKGNESFRSHFFRRREGEHFHEGVGKGGEHIGGKLLTG